MDEFLIPFLMCLIFIVGLVMGSFQADRASAKECLVHHTVKLDGIQFECKQIENP